MDAHETVLMIEGHRKRHEVLDDLFAHYASILLSPHSKKGRAPGAKKLRMIARTEESAEDALGYLSEDARRDFVAEHLARTGSPTGR